jgi:hypothetical protein
MNARATIGDKEAAAEVDAKAVPPAHDQLAVTGDEDMDAAGRDAGALAAGCSHEVGGHGGLVGRMVVGLSSAVAGGVKAVMMGKGRLAAPAQPDKETDDTIAQLRTDQLADA